MTTIYSIRKYTLATESAALSANPGGIFSRFMIEHVNTERKTNLRTATISKLPAVLLTFGLNAVAATPAFAVEDITFCDEINQPGSYRVTQDLFRETGTCLLIDSSNVTIDLQGHRISGDGSPPDPGIQLVNFGIADSGARMSNIEIRNGSVDSFQVGITLLNVNGARVEHVRAFNNSTVGVAIGPKSVVSSSSVIGNGDGIAVRGQGSLIMDNVVSTNTTMGIRSQSSSIAVRGNIVTANGDFGLSTFCPSHLSDNTIAENQTQNPAAIANDVEIRSFGCVLHNTMIGKSTR